MSEKIKGELNGLCNMSRCLSPNNVVWYNHGSMAYYCPKCAESLNNDSFNKREAMELFGHELCTKDTNH